jgi:hypothetical protein
MRFSLGLFTLLLMLIIQLSVGRKNDTWSIEDIIKRRASEKWMWGYENDSFPHGHNSTGRIAIILTGQLRSANRTFNSGYLISNAPLKMFGENDPPSTAATIIEWLFKPLARKFPLDVFMYLTAHPEHTNENWDGRPESYEPEVGDTRGCEIFSSNDVFNNTGNRFFCLVEPEVELMNQWIQRYSFWGHYYTSVGPPPRMKEQALQQLYAMYRANLACKQFALAKGLTYSYKIRLRPDTAFVKPFPDISVFDFAGRDARNVGTIYYANRRVYNNGNEDWFNVGRAEHMDHLLDRYIDFISLPLLHSSSRAWFTLEESLVGTMGIRYGITMGNHNDIWMVVIRNAHHAINTWTPPPNPLVWKEVSVFNETDEYVRI